jgi:excisionase family DNA binding protein
MLLPQTPSQSGQQLVVMQADELSALLSHILEEHSEALFERLSRQATAIADTHYITREEACQRLKITLATLNRRLKDGSVPHKKLGRRVLIDVNALEQQLQTA